MAQRLDSLGGRLVCGLWEVIVPAGSVPDGSLWHCTTLEPQAEARAKVPAGYNRLWRVVRLTVTTRNELPIRTFTPPLTICAHYTEPHFEMAGNDAARLRIYSAPAGSAQWADLQAAADPAVPRVCATTASLSDFQLVVKKPAPARQTLFGIDWRVALAVGACLTVLVIAAVVLLVTLLRRRKKQKK